eukprot:1884116-Pleurochrysis_carterae.AAC.1
MSCPCGQQCISKCEKAAAWAQALQRAVEDTIPRQVIQGTRGRSCCAASEASRADARLADHVEGEERALGPAAPAP